RGHDDERIGSQRSVLHRYSQQGHGEIKATKNQRGKHPIAAGSGVLIKNGHAEEDDSWTECEHRGTSQAQKATEDIVKARKTGHFRITRGGRVNDVLHEREQITKEDHLCENGQPSGTDKAQAKDNDGADDEHENT